MVLDVGVTDRPDVYECVVGPDYLRRVYSVVSAVELVFIVEFVVKDFLRLKVQ